jgi:hypothetical protein
MLIQQIESHTVLPPRAEMLESEIIERASVARPNENRASVRRAKRA